MHAKIRLINEELFILDCNSRFGTLIEIKEKLLINEGSNNLLIQSNQTVFEFLTDELS